MTVQAGIELQAPLSAEAASVLTPEAQVFLAELHRRFEPRRQELLRRRRDRQAELDQGVLPDFLAETREVRESDWTVASIPDDLKDRRVEITGPVDRKMVINALNSGASTFMADFEDSNAPTWQNNLEGQVNLRDAVRRSIAFTSPEGKEYRLKDRPAVLLVRPRGWHLDEKHLRVDGTPISGSLFDFGLFLFHNAREQLARGTRPYFYLPKLEAHQEARLWNDVFLFAQEHCQVPRGSIRATVLIETILAAFEMHEILHELREHSSGLNCGRWDYIFSFIKKFRNRSDKILPDRAQVTMDRAFLKAYVDLLIQTCHRRGIHAMGGMAAQIPIKNDPVANEAALSKVRQDKLREVKAGHDGTWVAHPGLVPLAREVFDEHMSGPNQLDVKREDVTVGQKELLEVHAGSITEAGLHVNVDVGIQYLEAWLRGVGCVPIYNLMEDAATAEISRSQVWQWVRHGAKTDQGVKITAELVRQAIAAEKTKLAERLGGETLEQASRLFEKMMTAEECAEFLTLEAYPYL